MRAVRSVPIHHVMRQPPRRFKHITGEPSSVAAVAKQTNYWPSSTAYTVATLPAYTMRAIKLLWIVTCALIHLNAIVPWLYGSQFGDATKQGPHLTFCTPSPLSIRIDINNNIKY